MYSSDRKKALETTIAFLRDMPLYDQCQKTLVVDGEVNFIPKDWRVVRVPRIMTKFCWGRMWDAGVGTAKYDKILYLDSDRLLPKNYLQLANDVVEDDVFACVSHHFMLLKELEVGACKRLLNEISSDGSFFEGEFVGSISFEPRFLNPNHGAGKNVMSGNTAFTKKTYWKLGGVDHWYCGHGAFADTDFHFAAAKAGCSFVDLGVPELHYPHPKKENGAILTKEDLWKLGLENFIYYCNKWGLPISLAEEMAFKAGVKRPRKYVDDKLKESIYIKSIGIKHT